MSALKELKALHFENWRRLYPAMDQKYYAPPKFSDTTANGLTKCIIHYLQFNNCQAERISSQGRVIDRRKTYVDTIGRVKTIGQIQRTYSTSTNGTADISATVLGRSVKIEVKIGKDTQSNDQKGYQESVEAAGGVYLIASTLKEFVVWYKRFTEE